MHDAENRRHAFSQTHIEVVDADDADDADNGGAGNHPVHFTLVEDASGRTVGQQMVGAHWPHAFRQKPRVVEVMGSHLAYRLTLQEATSIVAVETTRQSTLHAKEHVSHA
ncbi:hypothetical protein WIW49_19510 [Xanthomonas euroxanthea]